MINIYTKKNKVMLNKFCLITKPLGPVVKMTTNAKFCIRVLTGNRKGARSDAIISLIIMGEFSCIRFNCFDDLMTNSFLNKKGNGIWAVVILRPIRGRGGRREQRGVA